jgi:hypothetical protein
MRATTGVAHVGADETIKPPPDRVRSPIASSLREH